MNPGQDGPLPSISSFGSEELRRRKAADSVQYNDKLTDVDFERMLREDNLPNKRQKSDSLGAKVRVSSISSCLLLQRTVTSKSVSMA